MAEPFRAKSISCSRCAHGTVFIHLHGPDGEVIATASMDVETAVNFGSDFTEITEEALELIRSGQAEPDPGHEVH